ncbi:MAG: TolC family protein [Syntrophobacteraceae bacterium]
MKNMQLFIALPAVLAVLPFGSMACGQNSGSGLPSQPLTLQAAVDYGLEHNRTLKAAKQDVKAVNQQVGKARADFYPKLDSQFSMNRFSEQPTAKFSGNELHTSSLGVNHWQVDARQPLFTGFGLTAKLNIAKMDLKISEYGMEETRLDVLRDIQEAFLQALLGEKLVQVAKDNVASLTVQRNNAEAQFKQGLTPQNDVLKADVALAQAQQQERSAFKQLIIIRSRLNQLLDLSSDMKLDLSEETISIRSLPSLSELYARAEERRPVYLSLDVSIKQADEGIRAARSRYYPQLSAFAQYYREGNDFTASHNAFANNENASVGLRVDMNLFEGGKTQAEAAEYQYRKMSLEEKRRELKHQVDLQVEDAYQQLEVTKANIDTAKSALAQAEENERMVTLQYKEQLVIFLEVLNAQVFLLQSRVDYYHALYGYRIALADLERAVGGPIE